MHNATEIIQDLRMLPCLSGLADKDLAAVGAAAVRKRFRKNEVIFGESDRAEHFFIVASGSIKLYKTSAEGRELLIRVMQRGDYFCCAPAFGGGGYSVNAVPLEDSTLVMIPAESFKEIISSGLSGIGLKVIIGMCARIRTLSNLVEDIAFKDVEQRVMLTLLRLADEKSAEDNRVGLGVTHHDIASMTGTVREVVSRTMSRLKKEEIVLESGPKGFVVDKKTLTDFLSRKTSSCKPL